MTTSGPMKEPMAPQPKQKQPPPGIESKMTPRPAYQAPRYRAAGKLENKVALITGGDSGIGRAVAVLYAREGADVAIVYLAAEESDARETEAAVQKEGRKALLIPGDVTDPKFCERAVATTVDKLGKLDILVNNAAYQMNQTSLDDLTIEQFDRTFRTNVYGYFFMVKAAVPKMKEGSVILNTGSQTGFFGNKEMVDYSATKGAIHTMTKALSGMLVGKKIRVNCVVPGPIWTPLQTVAKPEKEVAEHGSQTPLGRPGQPEEVAPAYVFLASEADSSYITGELLPVIGGMPYGA
jgi:NAD(P)-dependent dehydrogenase (short-subunit alcohol dehydrogenase family)